jgi:hypothetical protein
MNIESQSQRISDGVKYPFMNEIVDWRTEFENEIKQAEAARSAGNEGRARVCARRAAGIAIGEFLTRQGIARPGPSAIERLILLENLSGISFKARQASHYLTLRVNTSFELPVDIDLIHQTKILFEELFGEQYAHPGDH